MGWSSVWAWYAYATMASCATSRVSGLGARGRGSPRGRAAAVRCRAAYEDTREWVYREAPGLATGITVEEAARRVATGELTLVDIRAGYQRERARVPGSIHVPLFVEDQRNDPSNFVRRNFFQYGCVGPAAAAAAAAALAGGLPGGGGCG